MARLFIFMFLGHIVGDFLLQTENMALRKKDQYFFLTIHCIIYSICVSLGAFFVTQVLEVIIIIFLVSLGTHLILDRRHLTYWYIKKVKLSKLSKDSQLIFIIIDQCFHILILIILAELLSGGV